MATLPICDALSSNVCRLSLTVFASEDAASRWFPEHDPEGVAFEYPVLS